MRLLRRIPIVLVIVALSSSLAMAGQWILLGERAVDRLIEKDTIHVGAEKGTFTKIRFRVRRSGVNFHDVKVYFANGEVFDVSLKTFIKAGEQTRIIDLPGKNRKIDKVVFWYDTDGVKKGKGKVKLFGRQ